MCARERFLKITSLVMSQRETRGTLFYFMNIYVSEYEIRKETNIDIKVKVLIWLWVVNKVPVCL